MRPIVNLPEEVRATDIGNTHKIFAKDRKYGSGDILADRQTDTQTDILITILRNRKKSTRLVAVSLNAGYSDVTAICVHITISMLWDNTAYCVKLSGEDLSCYSNKIESVDLRNYYHYLTKKVMPQ